MLRNEQIRVVQKQQLASRLYKVMFEATDKVDFLPGQHMSLKVADHARRSYSMANVSDGGKLLETYVETSPGGPGSLFFDNVQQGDEVHALFPLGHFLYEQEDCPVYFFATGTGIVPFLSMLRHELLGVGSGRQVRLFYGVRHEQQIIAEDLLAELQTKYDNFGCETFVSQPENWAGKRGRVTDAINSDLPTHADYYICGGTQMIAEVEERLLQQGITQSKIKYEKFY